MEHPVVQREEGDDPLGVERNRERLTGFP